MQPRKDVLATLPVELLYEIHFLAASEALPLTCRRLHDIFKNASPAVHADYLIARYAALPSSRKRSTSTIAYALRFPLCSTPAILAALLKRPSFPLPHSTLAAPPTNTSTKTGKRAKRSSTRHAPPELPKRLFNHLSPSGAEVLPLLRFLYTHTSSDADTGAPLRPDPNSHDGYPLAHAVSAGAVPVVRFLLEHGASPCRRNALAVTIAIKRRDLALVRLLVEPPEAPQDERGRPADRVQVTSEMLTIAVMSRAHDVAEYLMNEKGCVPDLKAISSLTGIGTS